MELLLLLGFGFAAAGLVLGADRHTYKLNHKRNRSEILAQCFARETFSQNY